MASGTGCGRADLALERLVDTPNEGHASTVLGKLEDHLFEGNQLHATLISHCQTIQYSKDWEGLLPCSNNGSRAAVLTDRRLWNI